jgi:hypothetical protein
VAKAVELLTGGAEAIAEIDPDRARECSGTPSTTAIRSGRRGADRRSARWPSCAPTGPVAARHPAVTATFSAWKGDAVAAATAWRRSADLADAGRRLEPPTSRPRRCSVRDSMTRRSRRRDQPSTWLAAAANSRR